MIERKPHQGRKQPNRAIYKGARWQQVRMLVLQANPLCVMCEDKGLCVAATVVDHRIPINQGGAVYDQSNLQGLCKPCHDIKSAQEGGQAWRRKEQAAEG